MSTVEAVEKYIKDKNPSKCCVSLWTEFFIEKAMAPLNDDILFRYPFIVVKSFLLALAGTVLGESESYY